VEPCLSRIGKSDAAVVFEDGMDRLNPRHAVMVINSARLPKTRYDLARKCIDFIIGARLGIVYA
jgi:hypothetical protein